MNDSTSEKILLVDDDQALLDAFRRNLRKQYDLETAQGGAQGLEAIALRGPFAIVISDYQMPRMNGIEFLERVRVAAPDTVRVMLTGNADLRSAIEAVNQGQVFRFLTKPCTKEEFLGCLESAFEQYRLVTAERELLEHTVRGSIQMLAEVLSLANPAAFGRAMRIQHYVHHIVEELDLEDAWQFETAALLCQVGCIAIPDDVFDRISRGESLPPEQLEMLEQHPQIARDLLSKIPRLQSVAEMVYHQRRGGLGQGAPRKGTVALGRQILAAALDFEEFVSLGATRSQALEALRKDVHKYSARILGALESAEPLFKSTPGMLLRVDKLEVGMILEEDIRNQDGALIVSKGHETTSSSLQRLRNYAQLDLLEKSEFRVREARQQSTPDSAAA